MVSEFAKEKIFWTRKMNLNLVNFIKSKPHIWNSRHPKYTSIELRDQTYAEFASMYGNEFSSQAVKQRWTNIRSTFSYYLRKLKAAETAGETYIVNWHLWQPSSFLLNTSKVIRETTTDQQDLETVGVKFEKVCTENNISEASQSSDEEVEPTSAKRDCQEVGIGILNAFREIHNDPFGVANTRNGKIGTMVAEHLSQMPPFEASQVSCKIMEVLLRYDDDNPNNPNLFK